MKNHKQMLQYALGYQFKNARRSASQDIWAGVMMDARGEHFSHYSLPLYKKKKKQGSLEPANAHRHSYNCVFAIVFDHRMCNCSIYPSVLCGYHFHTILAYAPPCRNHMYTSHHMLLDPHRLMPFR